MTISRLAEQADSNSALFNFFRGEKMPLTQKKIEQLKKQPIVESRVFKSQDGKYIVHRTSIINIKPIEYYKSIMAKEDDVEEEWF